jgi:sec-independent protein translocase protein TatA
MPNIGPLEIVVILIIALIVFGPKRLPELGRSMGKGIREFKSSLTGDKDDDDDVRELEPAHGEPARRETTAREEEEAPLEGEVVHDRRS